MTHNTPLSPRPLSHLSEAPRHRVLTANSLRAHGIPVSEADARCRPGGPWQLLLPGVYLLHPGPPTSDERLHAALLYAGGECAPIPAQQGAASRTGGPATDVRPCTPPSPPPPQTPQPPQAMITGLAALTLHGFDGAPSLRALDRIDVLVPWTRRLRSTGGVRVVRGQSLPDAEEITGVPVAPVARALADTVALLPDAGVVRRLLVESVRAGHCEAGAVVGELIRARLLGRPHVRLAVDALVAESRALAEGMLYEMVFRHRLPCPCWNVDLRLPGGPYLGGVDAFWPEQSVAVELDTRTPRPHLEADARWSEYARKREALEVLGITVVHLTPAKLRDSLGQQAAIVRTALMTAVEREPAEYVIVTPR
ncbi:hypothetical protein [Streptomyces nanshensis]|uniref:DUF559 domain-containing protein n=1 Tax=Streptomyces nanshensis TaxID=518642 RepID=A0A1E7L080_9ACTN|nr:hypothetical protein [Streptomyces nanshensis]OEV09576.1 hypothetical protein AN218_21405 [Streptomyces nanshensis]